MIMTIAMIIIIIHSGNDNDHRDDHNDYRQ